MTLFSVKFFYPFGKIEYFFVSLASVGRCDLAFDVITQERQNISFHADTQRAGNMIVERSAASR